MQLPVITPRACADQAFVQAQTGLKSGFLFGAERAGLETKDLGYCHAIVTIPVSDRFSSLNLAQAVALVAYEYRQKISDAPKPAFSKNADQPAQLEHLHGLYQHLEDELEKSGFFFPFEKAEQMKRNLRVTLNRAGLTEQEVRTWRGVVTALTKGRGRVLERIAKMKAAKEI